MTLSDILNVLQDLPGHLAVWTAMAGPWIYVGLFAVIFAETGLVVTPLLPGDSLLFALGALTTVTATGAPAPLDFGWLAIILIVAANTGDLVNFSLGRWLGPKLFRNPNSKILNPAYLERTNKFYEEHGGKAVVLARFLPILRTYAPFVAGLGRMPFKRFAGFSVFGGALWILLVLGAGHLFGNLPVVKSRFHYVILAIIVITLLPAAIEFIRARRSIKAKSALVSNRSSEL